MINLQRNNQKASKNQNSLRLSEFVAICRISKYLPGPFFILFVLRKTCSNYNNNKIIMIKRGCIMTNASLKLYEKWSTDKFFEKFPVSVQLLFSKPSIAFLYRKHNKGRTDKVKIKNEVTQLTFTCSKSTIKTLEKGVKFVQS